MSRRGVNNVKRSNTSKENLVAGGNVGNEDIELRVLYEDPEVLVVTAPNEDELREIVLSMLRTGPKTLKDIHTRLAGIASEDKIRRCLVKLIDDGLVVIDDDGRYRLIGTEGHDNNGEEIEPPY
jgi:hypothetical protein